MEKSKVLKYFGSGAQVARALKITRQAVSGWPDVIPEYYALRLEKVTRGGLVYHEDYYRER